MKNFTHYIKDVALTTLTLALASMPFLSTAQTAASYGYSAFSGTYTDIVGGTLTGSNVLTDDGTQTNVPIGFNFDFCGSTYNQMSVAANGYIYLSNVVALGTTSYNNVVTNIIGAGMLMPYWDDGYGSTTGAFSSYIVTGVAPNRVFTLEWKNWGFCCSTTPNLSYQIKLFETTNVIQFLYKPILAAIRTATIGIANSQTDWQVLSDATPAATTSSTNFNINIATQPVLGQIYQFAPPVPCSGIPNAVANIPASVCPNVNFTMNVSTTPPATGLTYSWEKSANGTSGWTNFATSQTATDNINTPTYYHCIVTCTNTPGPNNSLTTPTQLVQISNFLTCYCTPTYTNGGTADNITNVVLKNLQNNTAAAGNPLPYFQDYTPQQPSPLPIPFLTLGADDTVHVSFNSDPNQYCGVWIDYNRDGVFSTTEYFTTNTNAGGSGTLHIPIHTPINASTGITRMRIRGGDDVQMNATQPCGPTNSTYGESEDYYVDVDYPPCTGPAIAGIAYTTDTAMCPNYPYILTDTSHERFKSGLSWSWQQSNTSGNTWTDVPNSLGKDTLHLIFSNTVWYRFRIICTYTHDTTYSNVLTINLKPPYKCYGFSTAEANDNDSSDIGAFSIGTFLMNTGGPHLLNPKATRGRTDYTDEGPVELYSDSTYEVVVYHTLRTANHADAYITMFIDFNNNLQYDLPEEAIYLTTPNPPTDWLSTANDWYVINEIRIPHEVIPDVPTGMRVILNNDVAPGLASTTGYGLFTSGETEDYTVVFRRNIATNVSNVIKGMDNLALYPNPTDGNFTVSFNATQPLQNVQVNVMDITGRIVKSVNYGDVRGSFTHQLNLTSESKGIYFVEVKADNQKITRRIVVK